PDMYILGDVYTLEGFKPVLYLGEQQVPADRFELDGLKFVCFSSANQLREKAAETDCDCIILTESAPVLAGSRQLLKDLLVAVQSATGRTVFANLGGYGFTSHPDVYLPAVAYISSKETFFTTTLPQFVECEKCYTIESRKGGSGMFYNLPRLEFDLAFNKNPLMPAQIDEKAYSLDLFHLQAVALAARMSNINCKNAVVAVSGGLDSALALLVTVNAFDLMGIDRKGIRAISMPGFGTSNTTKSLAQQLVESLGLDFELIDITKSAHQALLDIGHDAVTPDVTFENVQARMRTLHGLNLANATGGIMIGTGDLSEEALGFSTYGGDHLASYNVNSSISKTVIRTMLPHVIQLDNMKSAAQPITDILNIPVSPELVPHGGEILQKTEEILAPYKLIDFFIYCFIVAKLSPIEMAQRASCVFEGEFGSEYLKDKAHMLCRRFITGQFKRSCAPEGAALTHVHLNGANRSVPSDSAMGIFNHYLGK
ncbi:MAG: hypothetical protein IKJ05_05085, partial [Oscillospiraceae bacterium]|nr:hypothetical protein [Oscillospiraceae bacterium]